jgi:hypothetical protein
MIVAWKSVYAAGSIFVFVVNRVDAVFNVLVNSRNGTSAASDPQCFVILSPVLSPVRYWTSPEALKAVQ